MMKGKPHAILAQGADADKQGQGGAGGLARGATLMAGATVASRVLALVREIVAAALFGATNAKAAYVIAYYVPFFVQRLLLGGTLRIVFIPTISRLLAPCVAGVALPVSGS